MRKRRDRAAITELSRRRLTLNGEPAEGAEALFGSKNCSERWAVVRRCRSPVHMPLTVKRPQKSPRPRPGLGEIAPQHIAVCNCAAVRTTKFKADAEVCD